MSPYLSSLKILDNVLVVNLVLTLTVITFRRVIDNQHHEWIVYSLSLLLRSVGHRVKTHKITPTPGHERGDIEIQDYLFLPYGEDDRIPPRTLVMDVTMTNDRYGRTTQHTNGALTHRVPSTGNPQPDGALNKASRMKIRHYLQIYTGRPDPIVFLSITVRTSGRVYEDFA